ALVECIAREDVHRTNNDGWRPIIDRHGEGATSTVPARIPGGASHRSAAQRKGAAAGRRTGHVGYAAVVDRVGGIFHDLAAGTSGVGGDVCRTIHHRELIVVHRHGECAT